MVLAGVTTAIFVDGGEVFSVGAVGDVEAPRAGIDGASASLARWSDTIEGIGTLFNRSKEIGRFPYAK